MSVHWIQSNCFGFKNKATIQQNDRNAEVLFYRTVCLQLLYICVVYISYIFFPRGQITRVLLNYYFNVY